MTPSSTAVADFVAERPGSIDSGESAVRDAVTAVRVSIVVPIRNESRSIRSILQRLAELNDSADDYEILVVDGASDDGTPDIVQEMQLRYPQIRLFHNPKRWSSAARNVGIRNARGEFIVIVDGHCDIADPRYPALVIDAFERSGADCLGRPQPLRIDEASPFQRAVGAARRSWLGHNPDSAIFSSRGRFVPADNVAVAYRREVFDRVGLFDESFDACEDVEFNTRVRKAGFTCYFAPELSVDYHPRSTWRGLVFQMMRYGQGRSRLGKKDLTSITAPSLVPPLWMCWLLGSGIAGIFWTPAAVAFSVSVASYLVVILGESIRTARSEWGVSFFRVSLVFLGIHFGFGWGYLREAVGLVRHRR